MSEALLITKDDIDNFWNIGKNISEPIINNHILRGQQVDLKPFIGDHFYWFVVNNIGDAQIIKLLDGEEYERNGKTVLFGGLKQLLAAYSYRRLVGGETFVTRGGSKRKLTEESENEDDSQINQEARGARSEAARLEGETNEYLDQERKNYPNWNNQDRFNDGKKTGFRITKI